MNAICKNCGKKFVFYDRKQGKFCSLKCYRENRWGESHKIKSVCKQCRKIFYSFLAYHQKFCSKKCVGKWRTQNKIQSPAWKGGKISYGLKNKYWAIYQPHHPFVDCKGYVMEHRLVMEGHLKRFLNPEEVIHHINQNGKDNRIENLQLMTKSEHNKFETLNRWKNNHIKPFRRKAR